MDSPMDIESEPHFCDCILLLESCNRHCIPNTCSSMSVGSIFNISFEEQLASFCYLISQLFVCPSRINTEDADGSKNLTIRDSNGVHFIPVPLFPTFAFRPRKCLLHVLDRRGFLIYERNVFVARWRCFLKSCN